MNEPRKSPSSESPAGDGSHPDQEAERAPNPSSEARGPKAEKTHGRQKRATTGTGALLSRITGLLRSAAEEAPGDPIIPAAGAQPAGADTQRSQPAEELDESGFLESLRGQPRQGTGHLRIMVTGALRGPEDEAEKKKTDAELDNGSVAAETPAAVEAAAEEDVDEILSRLTHPTEVTGRLNAPFTGTLRAADDLSDLRAEMEVESQPSLPDDEESLLDLLLGQREIGAEAAQENTPLPVGEEDDARLEDRFAMLGVDAPAPFVPQSMASEEEPVESVLASAEPAFDDAVMFPDELLPPPFVESTIPAAASEPGDAPDPIRFAAPETHENADVLETAAPVNQVIPEPTPRGKAGKRSETIFEDLRQTLAEEESTKRRRGTGGLLRRITGSLRRTTDSLRKGKTGPMEQPELQQPPLDSEQVQNLLEPGVETDAMPDFSMFDLDNAAEEPPSEPAWSIEADADLPEDALLAGLDASGQPVAEEPVEEDWMTAIRQEGVEETAPADVEEPTPAAEEAAPAEPAPEARTRTITGRLAKMVTGVLGGQAARKKTTKELDIPDEMVTGRLQRSMVTGPLNPSKTRQLDSETLEQLEREQTMAAQEAANVEDGTPVDNAAEEAFPEPRNQGITGQLRSFITGILRSSEPPGSTGPLQTGELPDSMIANRVEQDAPTRQRSTPRRTSERRETFDAQSLRHDVIDIPAPTPGPAPAAPEVLEEELLRNLGVTTEADSAVTPGAFTPAHAEMDDDLPEDRFGAMFGGAVASEAYSAGGETGALEEVDENSGPFGEAAPGALGAEDIWGAGGDQGAADTHATEETIWFVPEEDEEGLPRGTGSLFDDELSEEALVSAYLAGQGVRKEPPPQASTSPSAPDLRAIALENYGEAEEISTAAQDAGADGEEAGDLETGQPAGKLGLWDRIARLTVLQKILLAEVVLLVVLVPFLVFAALTAPKAVNPVIVFPMPRSLPEGVPYPTGLTLPGGWRFDLQKSTFAEGDWKPTGSEWLEGTEVRRVVALPWNKQTDAVVRTFQPGDTISLTLSNQDEVEYEIISVERRTSTEADFLADRKLSLVVLFYDEASEDRWVITGER